MATKQDQHENDHQLRIGLEKMGVRIGPITDSTRAVYQRKLRRLSAGNTVTSSTSTASRDREAEQEEEPSILQPARPQPSPAAGLIVLSWMPTHVYVRHVSHCRRRGCIIENPVQ